MAMAMAMAMAMDQATNSDPTDAISHAGAENLPHRCAPTPHDRYSRPADHPW
jgi:hypothetical protein